MCNNLYRKKIRDIATILHEEDPSVPIHHTIEGKITTYNSQIHSSLHAHSKSFLIDLGINSDFELHQVCKTNPRLSKYSLDEPKKIFQQSGKLLVLDGLLDQLIEEDHRILIFSQMSRVLDILECFLNHKQILFTRLDGQTKVTERQNLIDDFTNEKKTQVFLLTTTAGGKKKKAFSSNHTFNAFPKRSWNQLNRQRHRNFLRHKLQPFS